MQAYGIELNVTDSVWVAECRLDISFSDGTKREVDFGPFLSCSDQPEIREYMDVERFKAFEICYGNLVWNDYDLCFSIEDLYAGQLTAHEAVDSKVAEEGPGYQVGE